MAIIISYTTSALQANLLMITCFIFILLSQTDGTHNITPFKKDSKLPNNQKIYRYSNDVHWSCLKSNSTHDSKVFDCCKISYKHQYAFVCTEFGPFLRNGHCATYDGIELSIGLCNAYFLPSGYNMTIPGYIPVPIDLTELNKSMCGPLNRKGLVCCECENGLGLSVTSFVYKCTNCTNAWYNVPLFLFLEFVPVTAFYFVILIFRVGVTSPPMPCFIMIAQIIVYTIDKQKFGIMFTEEGDLTQGMKIIRTVYGLFYLDFFRYISPPLCLSRKLNSIHIALLGNVTVFYPLLLIFLTWACVELHDRNVRIIVWLWRPFHKCFARLRKRWEIKSDLIDVFITFFTLSYYNIMFSATKLLKTDEIINIDQSGNRHTTSRSQIDPSMHFFSKNSIYVLAVVFAIVLLIFNALIPLVLILYPIRALQLCLSKCRLNFLTVIMFTDKIQSCYRNGLDGGRDMRCFSGFYFYLRMTFHVVSLIFYHILKMNLWTYFGVTFFISALIIALTRPYRKTYMNTIDALLLTNIALLYFCSRNLVKLQILYLLLTTPIFGLILLLLLRMFYNKKCLQKVKALTTMCCNKLRLRRELTTNNSIQTCESDSLLTLPTATHPLIQSLRNEVSYGTNNEQ